MRPVVERDPLEPMSTPSLGRRLWTSSLFVSTATIASRVGGFLGNVIAIRLLDPDRVGQIGVIESWIGATTALAIVGLGAAVTRQVARTLDSDIQEAGELSTAAVLSSSGLGVMISLGVFGFLKLFAVSADDPTLQTLSRYAVGVSGYLLISTVRQIVAALAYGLQAYRALLLSSVIVGVLSPPLSWFLVALYGVPGALALRIVLLVVETAILGYAAAHQLRSRGANFSIRRFPERARQLFSFGFPIAVGDIITTPVQPFMLSVLARQPGGLMQVAILTTAGRLSSISSFLPGSLASTVTPLLSGEWGRGDRDRFAAGALLTIRAFWFTTLPIVTLFVVSSPVVLRVVFGDQYADAWPVASVVLITTLLVSLNQTADRAFVSAGKVWLSSSNNLVLIVLFLVLGFVLIPSSLAMGYSVALFVAFLAYLLWQYYWLIKLWHVPVHGLRFESLVSMLVLATAVVLAGTLTGAMQIVGAVLFTGVVVAVEFRYFLRTAERHSLRAYLGQVVRRHAA